MNTSHTYKDYVNNQFNSLISHDSARFHKLLQIAQSSILFFVVSASISSYIDHLFKNYDPEKNNKDIFLEVILQIIVISITMFYVRKVVKLVPYIFSDNSSYMGNKETNRIDLYHGELIMVIVIFATQSNLIHKIQHLTNEFKQKYFSSNDKKEDIDNDKLEIEKILNSKKKTEENKPLPVKDMRFPLSTRQGKKLIDNNQQSEQNIPMSTPINNLPTNNTTNQNISNNITNQNSSNDLDNLDFLSNYDFSNNQKSYDAFSGNSQFSFLDNNNNLPFMQDNTNNTNYTNNTNNNYDNNQLDYSQLINRT
tara:strand:+ start:276 stop:1202 length:927 start_codon:yes stop_codon:yes gene_type:complete